MGNDENFPAQCHPIIKKKKKNSDSKNETM